MRWKVKYSDILDRIHYIYYPYLDHKGCVTDPCQLWYNEFWTDGKHIDTLLDTELVD